MPDRPARRPQSVAPAIRVALEIADRGLCERIIIACEEADGDIVIAGPDETPEDVDVVLADRPTETSTPVIAIVARFEPQQWHCDLRAAVPPDTEPIGAVIRVVAAGLTVMPRHGADARDHLPFGDDEPSLTPREHEVLTLLAEGASNKAIARALGLSIHTVKFHVASVTEKLGATSRLEAVAIAIRAGLVMV